MRYLSLIFVVLFSIGLASAGNDTVNERCVDTDGGKDYYTKGTVTAYRTSGTVGPDTDYCDGDTLREISCYGLTVSNDPYSCPNGCSNGVCLDSSSDTNTTDTDDSDDDDTTTNTTTVNDSTSQDPYPETNVTDTSSNNTSTNTTSNQTQTTTTTRDTSTNTGSNTSVRKITVTPVSTLVTGAATINTSRDESTCSECARDGKCYSTGTRINTSNGNVLFCNLDNFMENQRKVGDTCQNNYECETNFCSNGECYDLVSKLNSNTSLLQWIIDFLKKWFD